MSVKNVTDLLQSNSECKQIFVTKPNTNPRTQYGVSISITVLLTSTGDWFRNYV